MSNYLVYSLLFLLINSFIDKQQIIKSNKSIYEDTIKFDDNVVLSNDTCIKYINTYSNQDGIYISNYYLILDTLEIDLNDDNYLDKLLVLGTLSLDRPSYMDQFYCFEFDTNSKRLLVELINNKGKFQVRNKYQNLLSNNLQLVSGYSGIYKSEKGFIVAHHGGGAKYSYTYSMEFISNDTNITLNKIIKTYRYSGGIGETLNDTIIYQYNGYPNQKINLMDTLDIQYNRGSIWDKLDMMIKQKK